MQLPMISGESLLPTCVALRPLGALCNLKDLESWADEMRSRGATAAPVPASLWASWEQTSSFTAPPSSHCTRLLPRMTCKRHFFKLIIYFWLHWVFVAAHGLSLVAASGGFSSLRCAGFSLRWLLLLRSMGSR